MSHVPENMEERLVPYVEGVLNAKEQKEVEAAIKADPELRREVEELRELIGDLREGFASGVRPPQSELTAEEVAQLSVHTGGVENLPGTSELKTRLFMSDNALAEYRMMQSLGEEMAKADLSSIEIPPMPDSLRAEFAAVAQKESKVVPLRPSMWKRATNWLDRIDPKPLTAAAAAFVMLSLGVHMYSQPTEQTMAGNQAGPVAFGQKDGGAAPPEAPSSTISGEGEAEADEAEAVAEAPAPSEPNGVAVFTSSDKELLKEQAEKLLAKKVRYTVTEDRILVSEKQVAEARDVLWGEDDTRVAIAEKSAGERLDTESKPKPKRLTKKEDMERFRPREQQPAPTVEEAKDAVAPSEPPPMKTYDYRDQVTAAAPKSKEVPGYRANAKTKPPMKEIPQAGRRNKARRPGSTGALASYSSKNSALRRTDEQPAPAKPKAPVMDAMEKEPADRPAKATNRRASKRPRPPETAEERKQRLRDLALGVDRNQDKSQTEVVEDADIEEELADEENAPIRQEISRARRAPMPPPAVQRQAPVANVLTTDDLNPDAGGEPAQVAVAEGQSQARMPEIEVAPVGKGGASRGSDWNEIPDLKGGLQPGAPPPPMPAPTMKKSVNTRSQGDAVTGQSYSATKGAEPARESAGADLRLASIRGSQAAVARRYNVTLSVESRGSKVNVYVRPRGELSKSEKEELRRAIRAELGLSPQDSIIFR